MELQQSQKHLLNQLQLQGITVLQMSDFELEHYLKEAAVENPLIDFADRVPSEYSLESEEVQKLLWLEEDDDLSLRERHREGESAYGSVQIASSNDFDETLATFLLQQIHLLSIADSQKLLVEYLVACLDETGYLTIPPDELAQAFQVSHDLLTSAFEILRSLDPAGVGATDLADCLKLQLQRMNYVGPAFEIVTHHLSALSRRNIRPIAQKMNTSLAETEEAVRLIRRLIPYPGYMFQRNSSIEYIRPDVFVHKQGDGFIVQAAHDKCPMFSINSYYLRLFEQTTDPAVKEYLSEKLQQAKSLKWAVNQRKRTLLRCAQIIVDWQHDFFVHGESAMRPLLMSDVAKEMGLHISTVSRATRAKYLQCSRGLFALDSFFSHIVVDGKGNVQSDVSARALLRELIKNESSVAPLSDQKLAILMSQKGVPISRRTITKYREEMGIPNIFLRRTQ